MDTPHKSINRLPQVVTTSGNHFDIQKAISGDIPHGKINFDVDKSGKYKGNILFSIPFNQYERQVHVHFTPEDKQYVNTIKVNEGDTATGHIYTNKRVKIEGYSLETSKEIVQKLVPQDIMQQAKQQRDLILYGKLTYRSLTGLSHAWRGGY